jgi:hypothetical protein
MIESLTENVNAGEIVVKPVLINAVRFAAMLAIIPIASIINNINLFIITYELNGVN